MSRTINLYPIGVAFILSAVVIFCLRLYFDEQKLIREVTVSARNMIPSEISGHPFRAQEEAGGPRYASPKLKGMVYTSDSRIDKWMKETSKK